MNKTGYILALCLLLCGLTVSAQRYERVFRDNIWNSSRNITGVRQDSMSRSYAEFYGQYEAGGFRDTWQAAEGWSAGAATASIRHLERISLAGSFSFDQTEGYGMCGSMFMKPGYYPVDILEFTPGRKTRQTYAFDGGIAYDLSPLWRIGAKMDFESANLAKRKDLRHTNWRLDMTVAPGLMYHKDDLAVGASYIFRKTSESVEAEQVGTAESSYYAFLDKGMMYGVYSVWSGSGLHLKDAGVERFPVKDFSNGAALQIQYKGIFAEVEYLHTQGSIGEKEYIWFNFPGNEASVLLGYTHKRGKARHNARLHLNYRHTNLDERVLEKVSENGVTTVYDHGSNRILTEERWTLHPEYEYITKAVELRADASLKWEGSLGSQMYPYVAYQSMITWKAGAEVILHIGDIDIEAMASFGKGDVHEETSTANGSSGVQTSLFRLQDWYERHMEYLTAPRLETGLGFRYSFNKGIYIKAEGTWMQGFGLKHLTEAGRFGAAFRIGYDF